MSGSDETTAGARVGAAGGRRALSAARDIYVGGVFDDRMDDWEDLDPARREKADRLILAGTLTLSLAALLLLPATLWGYFGTTAVHLFARTEYVRYTPLRNDPPQWLLEDVDIVVSELDLDELDLDELMPPSTPAAGGTSGETSDADGGGVRSTEGGTTESTTPPRPSGHEHRSGHGHGQRFEHGQWHGYRHAHRHEREPEPVLRAFDGFFQPQCGDTIIISRVGRGPLRVNVRSVGAPILTDKLDRTIEAPLSSREFAIVLPWFEEATSVSSSLVWPLEGRVDPGRAVGPQTNSDLGLLLEGTVEVVSGWWMDINHVADRHELEIGDQVRLPSAEELDARIAALEAERLEVERRGPGPTKGKGLTEGENDSPIVPVSALSTLCKDYDDSKASGSTDKGFIHLDGGAGMNLSLSSASGHVDILRYRTSSIRVENNWVKRIIGDPILALVWALFGVVFVLFRRFSRWQVSSLAREARKEKALSG